MTAPLASELTRHQKLSSHDVHLFPPCSQAAGVLSTVKRDNLEARGQDWSVEEEEAFKKPIRDQFDDEGSCYYSTARLWDDGVIDPADTRKVLGLSLSAALNKPWPQTKFGVFRM